MVALPKLSDLALGEASNVCLNILRLDLDHGRATLPRTPA